MVHASCPTYELIKSSKELGNLPFILSDDDHLLEKSSEVSVLDSIESSSFQTKPGLVSELLRPLTVEIGQH